MTRSIASPILGKNNARLKRTSKGTAKTGSILAEELFRRRVRVAQSSGLKRNSRVSMSPKACRVFSKPATKQHVPSHLHKHRRYEDEASDGELDVASKTNQSFGRYEMEDDAISIKSGSELEESDDEDEPDWLDGSTLIAQYQDVESETEEERAIALVEYLQVPLQEKSHELKRDLCNALFATINEIRQAHIKVDRGADVDRGKGIVYFSDACDKCHVNASHVQAQLKDSMGDNQIEIKQLFVQLKQAYNNREQLWVDLKARIDEITDLQAVTLNQLDDNMTRTVAALEKKSKAMLKDDSSKDKEKLLRGMLGKL